MNETKAAAAGLEKTGEVDMPNDLLVACPLKMFALRPAYKCEGCPYFHGLLDRFPGNRSFRFEQRYQVRCAGPVAETVSRNMVRVVLADD